MDGWTDRPSGWNLFDTPEYNGDIISHNLSNYEQKYIFVLAGGLDNLGHNHPWVKDRLDIALRLYLNQPRKIIILGGGTYHKIPHLNKEKYVIHESTMGAKYLVDHGVDPNDLYREWASYDTIANGFFSLINFIIPLQIKNAIVITSDFHMNRSKAIFDWIYQLWSDRFKKNKKNTPGLVDLKFIPVNTCYLDNEIIEARSIREARSLQHLQSTIERIDTWSKFHQWFYQEHQAYNCQFDQRKETIDHKCQASY